MKLRALFPAVLLSAASSWAALTVNVVGTMPTQALLSISGASTGVACQIEVSESNTYSPLVNDVNPTFFPGSDLDSRAYDLTSGGNRLVLIGTRRYETTVETFNASVKMFYNNLPSGILYTARTAGASGNNISIEYVVAAINQTLGVTVSGSAITVTIATNSGGNPTSTASDILAAVQANTAANALVSSSLLGDGTGMVNALKLNLTGGVHTVSRALQQATQHYYRISGCGTATGTFTTKTLPFGSTYSDLMSMTSTGAYLQPTSQDTRNFSIVDANTGVQQSMVSQYSDITNNGQPLDGSSGGSGSYCADDLSSNGYWHCAVPSHSASALYLYGINATTGNVIFLGQMVGAAAIDFGEEVGWAAGDANTLYFSKDINGNQTIQKWHYTGNDVPATGPSFVAPADPLVDMTGGHDLTEVARAFNSRIADNDLTGTVTTTIGTSCSATGVGSGTEYIVSWVSGAKFLDGHELAGHFIVVNGVPFVICDSVLPTQTTLHVFDRYGLTPAASPSAVAYRIQIYTCGLFGVQANNGLLRCTVGLQDSPSWQAVWDFGNGIPYGTGGSTAGIIAMMLPLENPVSRWTSNHTYEFMGEGVPIFAWQVSKIYDFGIGSGPYQVVLGTSLSSELLPVPTTGYTPVIDTNVTITSASLVGTSQTFTDSNGGTHICDDTWTTPAGWVDGQPLSPCYPHYLQTMNVGDVLAFVESDGSISEFVQIVAKHSNTSYDIQRGTQSDAGMSPSHTAGAKLTMWPESDGGQFNATKGVGWAVIMWDYVNSPSGTEHAGDVAWNWGIHATTRLKTRTETVLFDANAGPTNKAGWGAMPTTGLPVDSNFNGAVATASGNFFQKHPSIASGTDATQFDVYYFTGAFSPFATTVTCSPTCTHVYKITPVGPTLSPKLMSVFAKTKGKNLVDVSAPGKVLSDADDNSWCYTRVAGECAIGSAIGEVYASLSTLDVIGGNNRCIGGENPSGENDICIANFSPIGLANLQQKFLTNDIRGKSMRRLTSPFASWELQNELDGNVKLTYDGKYGLVWRFPIGTPGEISGAHGLPGHLAELWSIKIPTDPVDDGIDRTKFVPATLSLTAPGGLGVATARVKFWYPEWGGTQSNPYCTSRREGCVAVKSTIADASNFCSFANACPVDVTSLGLVTPYSPADNPMSCTDASGNPLSGSSSISGYDTIPSGGPPGVPVTQVRPFYPVNSNITCTIQGTAFSYAQTEAPTPAACSSNCTIALPVLPLHTANFNVEFLDSGGSVVANQPGFAMENSVAFLNPTGGLTPTTHYTGKYAGGAIH